MQAKLKVALVVSGAISLGSFESGVIEELVSAAQEKESPFEIDVIGGTSAGALTGAAVAYYVSRGTTGAPGKKFRAMRVWKEIDVDLLTQYDHKAAERDNGLLSRTVLTNQIRDVIGDEQLDKEHHRNDLLFFLTMASLLGREETLATSDGTDGVAVDIKFRDHSESVYFRIPARGADGKQWADPNGNAREASDLPAGFEQATGDRRFWARIFNLSLTSAALAPAWSARLHRDFENRRDVWWPNSEHLAGHVRDTGQGIRFVDGGFADNRPVLKMLDHAIKLRQWMTDHPKDGFDTPDLAHQIRYAAPPFALDRMLLFIEPDPSAKDMEEQEPNQERFASLVGGTLRGLKVVGRSRPEYTDLQWVGFVNESIRTAIHDTIEAVTQAARAREQERVIGELMDRVEQLEAELRRKEAAGTKGPEVAAVRAARDGLAASSMPNATQPGTDVAPDFQAAVDRFFESEWMRPGTLESLPLRRIKVDGVSPLAELRGPLQQLRGLYQGGDEMLKREVRTRFAQYLRHRGADGSSWVFVHRIAPNPEEQPLSRRLGHFGGFVSKDWMIYDYDLGRKAALAWLINTCPQPVGSNDPWQKWRAEKESQLQELTKNQKPPRISLHSDAEAIRHLLDTNPDAIERMTAQVSTIVGEFVAGSSGYRLGGKAGRLLGRAMSAIRQLTANWHRLLGLTVLLWLSPSLLLRWGLPGLALAGAIGVGSALVAFLWTHRRTGGVIAGKGGRQEPDLPVAAAKEDQAS